MVNRVSSYFPKCEDEINYKQQKEPQKMHRLLLVSDELLGGGGGALTVFTAPTSPSVKTFSLLLGSRD